VLGDVVRRIAVLAAAAVFVGGVAACGGGSSKSISDAAGQVAKPRVPPALPTTPVPPAPPTNTATVQYHPGVPASSLKCDTFAPADLQTAVQTVVPSATVTVQPDTAGVAPPGQQKCNYIVSTPGTDTRSGSSGEVIVFVTVSDTVSGNGMLADNSTDVQTSVTEFGEARQYAETSATGKQTHGTRPLYHDFPGVGKASYIVDNPGFQSDGTQTAYQTDLYILREPRPFSADVDTTYDRSNVDQSLKDKSLDAAMRDDTKRYALTVAIAKSVLAKIGQR